MQRTIITDKFLYKEVSLAYRKYRAGKLDEKNMAHKPNRIVCPMVDAGRSNDAYGKQFLEGLTSKDLEDFANTLAVSTAAMKAIAYFSGKKRNILGNIIKGKFDDKTINEGLIYTLKNGIHTGIYKDGKFDQEGLNAFVYSFHPQLKGISITNDWLYTDEANELYLQDSHLSKILDYNKSLKNSKSVGLGVKLSTFEMEKLLLGLLGQELINHSVGKKGLLIRDLHDLYKYGFIPVPVEDKFKEKNKLSFDSF